MKKSVLYVGLDVHKMSTDVALAEPGPDGEIRYYGKISSDPGALDRVIRRLTARGVELHFAYEAGPCGYQLYRHLTAKGFRCLVAAPSLIPRRPGDRLKNDRRDALGLARLLRAGELTGVTVPDADDEALRDLTRAREDAVCVARRAKQRTGAFLLRHGRRYPGKTTWGRGHWYWLSQQVMDHPAQQIVLQEYLDAVREATARVERLTGQIRELVPAWRRAPLVAAYQALRGVSLIVATTVAAEVGDLSRFAKAKELMAYLGLVPAEHSSGAAVRRGPITKTGNGHARRVLVEAAWAYRLRARLTRPLLRRQEGLPESVCRLAWKAQLRLCARYRRLVARGKHKNTIVTAIARELAAFFWALSREAQPASA
ncbi:MAG TPA: IS110 family transposase [Thioalkalivibrio sp.]|nr:IS110 family transposase [Thioalkalivibrio sp.]